MFLLNSRILLVRVSSKLAINRRHQTLLSCNGKPRMNSPFLTAFDRRSEKKFTMPNN